MHFFTNKRLTLYFINDIQKQLTQRDLALLKKNPNTLTKIYVEKSYKKKYILYMMQVISAMYEQV